MLYKKALGLIIVLLLIFTILFSNSVKAQSLSGSIFSFGGYGLYGASMSISSLYGGSGLYSGSASIYSLQNNYYGSASIYTPPTISLYGDSLYNYSPVYGSASISISPLHSPTMPIYGPTFSAGIYPLPSIMPTSSGTYPLPIIGNGSPFFPFNPTPQTNSATISIYFPLPTIENSSPFDLYNLASLGIGYIPSLQINTRSSDSETFEGIETAFNEKTDPSIFANCDELRRNLEAIRPAQEDSFYSAPTSPSGKVPSPPPIFGPSDINQYEDLTSVLNSEYNIAAIDDSYIYMIKDNSVRIIESLSLGTLRELSRINYDTTVLIPKHLYVKDDILIVIGDVLQSDKLVGYPTGEVFHSSAFGASSLTALFLYNIEDRSQVKKEREIKFVGSYAQSLIIGEYLYLIMNVSPPFFVDETVKLAVDLLPDYSDSAKHGEDEGESICDCHEVMAFHGNTEFNYLIIATIPLHDQEQEIGKKVILGKAEHFSWSHRHLYLDVTSGLNSSVHQFKFEDGSVRYENHMTITGKIIDRFAMDEHNGYLRVAACTETSSEKNLVIYLYDEEMKLIETLDNIAEDENIYSVHFLGNKGFIQTSDVDPATFDRVNKMIMLSLEDPDQLVVDGELEIEGAFDCLYNYEDHFLLTLGSLNTDVYYINENNFERKAAIIHENIKKIINFGEHFYTISDSKIKAINMLTYAEEAMLELE